MKPLIACVAAVVLCAGVDALAQGKGQGKGGQTQVKDSSSRPDNSRKDAQALGETAREQAGKGGGAVKGPAEDAAAPKHGHGGSKDKEMARPSDSLEKGKGQGKGGDKQAQAFQKQLQHEYAKHMARHARLVRIRELAAQKGDAQMVARVEKLMEKEQQIYGRKSQHLQGQPRATPQPAANVEPSAAAPAPPDSAGKGDKAPETNERPGAPDTGKRPGGEGRPKRNQ